MDYFLKQFLTGLRSYLQRMRRADNNECPYCRMDVELECERWENERRKMFGEFGESGLVERMVQRGLECCCGLFKVGDCNEGEEEERAD